MQVRKLSFNTDSVKRGEGIPKAYYQQRRGATPLHPNRQDGAISKDSFSMCMGHELHVANKNRWILYVYQEKDTFMYQSKTR